MIALLFMVAGIVLVALWSSTLSAKTNRMVGVIGLAGALVIILYIIIFSENSKYFEYIIPIFFSLAVIGSIFIIFSFKEANHRNRALGLLGGCLFVIGMISLWPPFRFSEWIRNVFLISTGQLVLIIITIFFVLVGYELFKAEIKGSYIKVSTWWYSPKSWWFVCFIILIFAALLESHIPDLMHRMGGVKTPWFEANLKVNESIIQRSNYALSDPSQILSLIIKADSVPEIGFYNIRESIERAVAYLNLLKLDYKTEMLLSNKTDENSISIIKIDEIDQRLKDLIDFENALKWIKHKKLNISEFDNVIRCLNNSNLRHCSNQIDSSSWAIKIKEIFENKSYKIMNPNELCDIGVPLIDSQANQR